jgi:hypothetical protein
LETNSASSASSGSFVVGIDLENYQSAGKDTIYAGYNTNTDDIFFLGNYYNAVGITARFDAFCHFDGLLVFENGTGYIKF